MARQRRRTDSFRPRTDARQSRRDPTLLVLVVDDNAAEREMYCSYFASQGVQFLVAGDGVTALRVMQTVRPDAIVMDLSMPRLDGWETTRQLKHDPRTAHIPILACTGHAFGPAVEHALDAGCDAYIVKPCLPAEVLKKIRALLARPDIRPA
jgi:two-component system, cell cycle response regulator DivK